MNSVFDINRFLKLEKRNLFFSKMQYLYVLAGFTGVYLLSVLLKIWADFSLTGFIYAGVFIVVMCGPCLFEKSRNKYTGVFDFILPASTFEKYLSIWLRYVVFIPVSLYLLLLFLNFVTSLIPIEAVQEHVSVMDIGFSPSLGKAFAVILSIQATYLAGYFYFKRYAFAKTSILVLFIGISFMVIGTIIGGYFLSGESMSFTFGASNEIESIQGNYDAGYTMGYALASIIKDPLLSFMDNAISVIYILGMWIVCFFKLRETEI